MERLHIIMLLEVELFLLQALQMGHLVLDLEDLLEDMEHQMGAVVYLLRLIVAGMK